jgi:uncharacterized protein YndB with AHSA1/START domain
MTKDASDGSGILGSLRSSDGRGVVHLEGRFNTGIEDVWSAITDPSRLARWHAQVEGDLRPGGTFRRYVEADDWEGTGRVEACEAPRHLVVTTRESEESWRKGQGMPPFDETLEANLIADGSQTTLVLEIRGLPLEPIAFFGVGWQIHMEKLAAHLDGRDFGDTKVRWDDLISTYQELAGEIGT